MCECSIGVDVRDGTASVLHSIVAHVVMGCIVLGRQMNVDFSISVCKNTPQFVRMKIRFCTMKIHDSMISCNQTIISIVVHLAIVQSYFCICTKNRNPNFTILRNITS